MMAMTADSTSAAAAITPMIHRSLEMSCTSSYHCQAHSPGHHCQAHSLEDILKTKQSPSAEKKEPITCMGAIQLCVPASLRDGLFHTSRIPLKVLNAVQSHVLLHYMLFAFITLPLSLPS